MPPAHQKDKHSGSIMVMAVLWIMSLTLIVFLTIYLGNAFLMRSILQNAADAGALAAAGRLANKQLQSEATPKAQEIASTNVTNYGFTLYTTPSFTYSSTSTAQYVQVDVVGNIPSYITGMGIPGLPQTVSAVAVAGYLLAASKKCIQTTQSILVHSGSKITALNCTVTSNGSISGPIDAGTITPNVPGTFPDPFVSINVPSSTPAAITKCAGTVSGFNPPSSNGVCTAVAGTQTYYPGKYSNINILAGQNVIFLPGAYLITGSGMSIAAGSTVTGTGVFFDISSASGMFSILPGSTINLYAATSTIDPYQGMLLKQESNTDALISGNLNGNLDFPNAKVHPDNKSGIAMQTGTIFATYIDIDNASNITMTAYTTAAGSSSSGKAVLYK